MSSTTQIYDLVLMLSLSTPDDDRAKIVSDVEGAISDAGGLVERRDDWGTRPLTFQIRHEAEAEYHLLQFSGPASLLDSLSHSLRINDGVLRFRIIKVLSGTPPPPDSAPPVVAGAVTAAVSAGPASTPSFDDEA